MPRRNQEGPQKRGSSRAGGRERSEGRSAGRKGASKPPRKSSTGDSRFKKPSSPSSFSKGTRPERKEQGPPRGRFSKFSKEASQEPRSDARKKPYASKYSSKRTPPPDQPARPASDSGRNFSQRSRFSKTEPKASPDKGRSDSYGKPFKRTYKSKRPSSAAPSHRRQSEDAPKSDKVRLNKFIANSGVSSRREADELIKMGLISVNGKIVSELGYKVNPGDEVRYEDKVLRAEKPVYILLNKPKGFITTTEDTHERKTVMHIIGSAVKERIYPVGRLDRNTTGLLLLTNDGDLADKLMHPSFNVRKVYKVELDRPLSKADFQQIRDGVRLEEGSAIVDDLAMVSEDGRTLGIELHIGWNRVVRRIFEKLGYEVVKLDRTVYAGLDKKELARGQWRFLTKQEIIHLKHFK